MVATLPAVFIIVFPVVKRVPGNYWRDQEICIKWSSDGVSKIQCCPSINAFCVCAFSHASCLSFVMLASLN